MKKALPVLLAVLLVLCAFAAGVYWTRSTLPTQTPVGTGSAMTVSANANANIAAANTNTNSAAVITNTNAVTAPAKRYKSASVKRPERAATVEEYLPGQLVAVTSDGKEEILIDNVQRAAGMTGNYGLMDFAFSEQAQKLYLMETVLETDAGILNLWSYDLAAKKLSLLKNISAYAVMTREVSPTNRYVLAVKDAFESNLKTAYVLDLLEDKVYALPLLKDGESYNGGRGGIGSHMVVTWQSSTKGTVTIWDEKASGDSNEKPRIRTMDFDVTKLPQA